MRRRQLLLLKRQKQELLACMQVLLVDLLLQWSKKQLRRLLPVNYRNGGRIVLLGNQLQLLSPQISDAAGGP